MWPRLFRWLAAAASALTAVILLVVLSSILRVDWIPWPVPAGLFGLAMLSAWRPAYGLLFVAALTPVASYLGRRWNGQVAWAETLVIAFTAGWWLRAVVGGRPEPAKPDALRVPTAVFALVVVASAVVELSVEQLRLGTSAFADVLWQYFSREYFTSGRSLEALHAAALLLEGLALYAAAARLSARDRDYMIRAAGTLVASAATATALNLHKLVVGAQRSADFWPALAGNVAAVRINIHYGDLNAAGSQFAMLLFVAGGLTLAGRRLGRIWALGVVTLLLGVWLSGSRAAIFACPVALAILIVAGSQARAERRTRRLIWGMSVVLAICAVALVVYAPARGNQKGSSVAVRVRGELARTSLRMVRDSPVFGIGLGRFYQRSGEFSSPELLALFPPARHENAHNNFLQILAETGITGLAAFVWLLSAPVYRVWRPMSDERVDFVTWGCLGGIIAFLLTCLGGHPLLTNEPAYAFWTLLGLMAGTACTAAPAESLDAGAHARVSTYLVTATALALAISIPFRARGEIRQADMEHVGIGVSAWQTSEDGVRYRSADQNATVFVPRGYVGFLLRLRAPEGPTNVELRLDGRTANVIRVEPSRWTELRMPLPHGHDRPRFHRLDLTTTPPQKLMIGKIEPF
jgi:O-antigen ligase